jgi:hypothetical protein
MEELGSVRTGPFSQCDEVRTSGMKRPRRSSSASSRSSRTSVQKGIFDHRPLLLILCAVVAIAQVYVSHLSSEIAAYESAFLLAERAAVSEKGSRRDYSRARREMAHDWWEKVVPTLRDDPPRFIRNFRVPISVMDEIVMAAERHPTFSVSGANAGRTASTALKVHMALWRLGRPALVADCAEHFGVSEGFVDKWTDKVFDFISEEFGHRLWGCK